MGININEQLNDEQIFEYKIPGFINEGHKMGNSSNDFEILQVLGGGGFSRVLKVKSKMNSRVYAMKKVDMNKILFEQKLDPKYYENEILILQKINHPNIIKSFKIFFENQFLYFIMEFMNNGDLESFYKANNSLKIRIPEEKLWDIFFKSLSGLLHIHKEGLIHRDIKPQNLFIDDNLNIKIGDFNISVAKNAYFAQKFLQSNNVNNLNKLLCGYTDAGTDGYMAPEIKFGKYDEKVDVYSMGIIFFELSYRCKPYQYGVQKEKFYNQKIYSSELNTLIDKMIQKDVKNRISSNEAYLIAKKNFVKKFVKNTAIEATLKCFYNFTNFSEYFCNNDYVDFLADNKREIGTAVFSIIQSLKENKNDELNILLYDLRSSMTKSGLNILKDNEEIDPGKFISFFIKKLNTELNEIINVDTNPKDIEQYKYFINSHLFPNGEEKTVFNDFINIYSRRILSLITRNFFSVIKTQRECKFCGNKGFNYTMLNFIPFNINILKKKIKNKNNLNIKDGFACLSHDNINLGKNKNIFCKNCKQVQEHKESKNFYHTAKNLIIVFDRGENCNNKTFIDFDEELLLYNDNVERDTQVQYQLIGIIEKVETNNLKEYISLTKLENNKWIDNKEKKINFQEAKKLGIVIALFYYCTDNNMILQPDFTNNNILNNNALLINNINPVFYNYNNNFFHGNVLRHQISDNIINNRMEISNGSIGILMNNQMNYSNDDIKGRMVMTMNNNMGMGMNNNMGMAMNNNMGMGMNNNMGMGMNNNGIPMNNNGIPMNNNMGMAMNNMGMGMNNNMGTGMNNNGIPMNNNMVMSMNNHGIPLNNNMVMSMNNNGISMNNSMEMSMNNNGIPMNNNMGMSMNNNGNSINNNMGMLMNNNGIPMNNNGMPNNNNGMGMPFNNNGIQMNMNNNGMFMNNIGMQIPINNNGMQMNMQ